MKKLIIIRSAASGLGKLLMKGSEAALAELPPPDPERPEKKRKVILITPEGSSDSNEKTVAALLLSNPDLPEDAKMTKIARHLKQLFTRAIAAGTDIVIVDNSVAIVVTEEACISDGKTFEYDGIQFVTIEEIVPNGAETIKRRKKFFS